MSFGQRMRPVVVRYRTRVRRVVASSPTRSTDEALLDAVLGRGRPAAAIGSDHCVHPEHCVAPDCACLAGRRPARGGDGGA